MKLGIDPGVGGALALLDESDNIVGLEDMPAMILKGKRQQVNAAELARLIRSWNTYPLTAYLEAVNAMPKQGVSSTFNFGMGYGVVQGVLAALSIPMVLVRPVVWKKKAGLIGKPKDQARTLAQQLYPAAQLGRKKDVGRADALLIARFGN